MTWTVDARVPVVLGTIEQAQDGDALLIQGDAAAEPGWPAVRFALETSHPIGCACCVSHGAAALALSNLFQARARGNVTFFRRVLAITQDAAGDVAVWAAVREDPLISGRFRIGSP